MNELDFNNLCDFIKIKIPETKIDFTNLNEIIIVLKKILDEKIITLSEKGIHHDEWPDDEELAEIEYFYNIVK